MTQFILGLNAALIAISTGVTTLDIADGLKTLIVFICGVALAFLSAFLPTVSATLRRVMGLQRRG